MIDFLWAVGGVLFFIFGLAFSIGLHELGHMLPAKRFGVKVSQYMIGFGKTIWSRKVGDTEYGLKWIPLGGYIRMIGMLPPKNAGSKPATFMRSAVEAAREQSLSEIGEGEERRAFYSIKSWQKLMVMMGGPFMNLILGTVILVAVGSGIGQYQPNTTVAFVATCSPTASDVDCAKKLVPAPAELAGLMVGDQITAFDGKPVHWWSDVEPLLTNNASAPIELTVLRNGVSQQISLQPSMAYLPVLDASGNAVTGANGKAEYALRPFIGIGRGYAHQPISVSASLNVVGQEIVSTAKLVFTLPQQAISAVAQLNPNSKRDPNGAISIVGIGQIASQTASAQGASLEDKLASQLTMLGGLNLALFVFNMLPLLPLDGGHVAGVIYGYCKRGFYRLRGKRFEGQVDMARMIPIANLAAAMLVLVSIVFVLRDFINPIHF